MKVKQFYVINTNSYKVRFCYRREARSPVGLKANKELYFIILNGWLTGILPWKCAYQEFSYVSWWVKLHPGIVQEDWGFRDECET